MLALILQRRYIFDMFQVCRSWRTWLVSSPLDQRHELKRRWIDPVPLSSKYKNFRLLYPLAFQETGCAAYSDILTSFLRVSSISPWLAVSAERKGEGDILPSAVNLTRLFCPTLLQSLGCFWLSRRHEFRRELVGGMGSRAITVAVDPWE